MTHTYDDEQVSMNGVYPPTPHTTVEGDAMEEKEYTSQEALKEWRAEKDQNNLTQNIVALLGIHGMHCKFYEYQDSSHITKAFEDLIHQQLQKARIEGLHAGIKRVSYYLEHKPRCYLYNEEDDASQCDCGLKEAAYSELD